MGGNLKTAGEVFPDGSMIEILRLSSASPELVLLYSDGKKVLTGKKLKVQGHSYTPVEFEADFLKAVTLPAGVNAYGSAKGLVDDLAKAVQNFTGLEHHFSRLSAFFFVATWFCDCLNIAPRLSVFGPTSRAVDQFMRLAAAFSRHGVLLTGLAPSGLLSLPFELGLTLLLRQSRVSPRMRELLNASKRARHFVMQNGKFVEPFSPVVLQFDKPIDELEGIGLPVWPRRQNPQLLERETEGKLAEQFQPRLLAFRLANFTPTRKSSFEAPELNSPIGDAARSLGACFSNDPELQAEIVSLLRTYDTHARVVQATNPEALVLEALLFHVHDAKGDRSASVYVGDIAHTIKLICNDRGNPIRLSPRAVGEILGSMGFKTEKLDRYGRGIALLSSIVTRVHELASERQVPSLSQGAPGCAACQHAREVQDRESLSS